MKVLMLVLMFFVLSALIIISNNGLVLLEDDSFGEFSELYVGWVNSIYSNAQMLTGEVVKLDWFPKEE